MQRGKTSGKNGEIQMRETKDEGRKTKKKKEKKKKKKKK